MKSCQALARFTFGDLAAPLEFDQVVAVFVNVLPRNIASVRFCPGKVLILLPERASYLSVAIVVRGRI